MASRNESLFERSLHHDHLVLVAVFVNRTLARDMPGKDNAPTSGSSPLE